MANELLEPTSTEQPDSINSMRDALRGVLGAKDEPAPPPDIKDIVPPVEPVAPETKPPVDPKPADVVAPEVKPAGEVKPSVDDPEEIKPPDKLTAKGKEGWSVMNKELREAKSMAKRLEEEIKTLKANPPAPVGAPDVALIQSQLEKSNQELEVARRELASVRLEKTPEFRKAFAEPMKAASDSITSLATASKLAARDFLEIADEPDAAKRKELFRAAQGELDELDRPDMRAAIETLAGKKAESARILGESAAALDAVETQRRTAQENEVKAGKQKFDKESEKSFRQRFAELGEKDPLFRKMEGNTPEALAWNKQVDAALDLSLRVDRDPRFLTDHAARGELIMQAIGYEIATKALKDIRQNYETKMTALTDENKKLSDTVARYTKGAPRAGGDTVPGPDDTPVDEKQDLASRVSSIFEKRTAPGK